MKYGFRYIFHRVPKGICQAIIIDQLRLWDPGSALDSIERHCHSLFHFTHQGFFHLLWRLILVSMFWSYLTEWFSSRPCSLVFLFNSVRFRSFFDFQKIIWESPVWTDWSISSHPKETRGQRRTISRYRWYMVHSSLAIVELALYRTAENARSRQCGPEKCPESLIVS
jgi:hypothetical protein